MLASNVCSVLKHQPVFLDHLSRLRGYKAINSVLWPSAPVVHLFGIETDFAQLGILSPRSTWEDQRDTFYSSSGMIYFCHTVLQIHHFLQADEANLFFA